MDCVWQEIAFGFLSEIPNSDSSSKIHFPLTKRPFPLTCDVYLIWLFMSRRYSLRKNKLRWYVIKDWYLLLQFFPLVNGKNLNFNYINNQIFKAVPTWESCWYWILYPRFCEKKILIPFTIIDRISFAFLQSHTCSLYSDLLTAILSPLAFPVQKTTGVFYKRTSDVN